MWVWLQKGVACGCGYKTHMSRTRERERVERGGEGGRESRERGRGREGDRETLVFRTTILRGVFIFYSNYCDQDAQM